MKQLSPIGKIRTNVSLQRKSAGGALVACIVFSLAVSIRPANADKPDRAVHALFNLHHPETGPFPSDVFTVPDQTHNTGRRVNLPYPDCTIRVSDCEDLAVVNTLDGFGLQTRLSIPFDGSIDVNTATSDTLFLISLGSTIDRNGDPPGTVIGINQIVWDTFTDTLHVESDELLTQHTRYALIVTNRLRDINGRPVEASDSFRRFRQTVRGEYKRALLEAIHAARGLGVHERDIVTASVFTTQSITAVMERIRDQIKNGTPEPANFLLGSRRERAVFNVADVTSIDWSQHTRVSPPGFTPANPPIDLAVLRYIRDAIGTMAYGYYVSPDYLVHPGEYIPAVGTRTGTPVVQGYNDIYFTLYLPSGPRPEAGWPIALIGGGATGNQHFTSGNFASKLAANGIATIGINNVGQGFGSLSTLTVNMTDGSSRTIPDAGRGIDQNGDNIITNVEGSEAAGPLAWTISLRDSNRQTVIDLMQLVRVIELGMDVDGDNVADIDPSRIYFVGASAGSMIGTILLALEPSVPVGVAAACPGVIPEHARWQPNRRRQIGLALGPPDLEHGVRGRTPPLINSPGLTEIDGVPIVSPYFNENKPLRNQPAVINIIPGAIDIQNALEFSEMASESGLTPVVWARHLREEPLAGLYPKSVIYQFAKGDQQAVNPGTTALIEAGNLADRTLYYRHDLAFAQDPSPTMPKNPHLFAGSPTSPNALFSEISRGAQDQIGTFLASDGTVVIHPEPAQFFEVPISSPLPEELNFIR
jgi:Bacterial virulence factor lipase N-terminal